MGEEELDRIRLFRPANNEQKLYTIGYEGIKACQGSRLFPTLGQ